MATSGQFLSFSILHVTNLQNENNKNSIPCKFECFFHNLNHFVFLQVWIMDPPSSLFTSNVGKLRAERALYFLPPPTLFQIDKHFKLRKFLSKLFSRYWLRNSSNLTLSTTILFSLRIRTQKYFKLSFLGQKINGCIDNNKPQKWKLKLWRKTKLFSLVD